MEPYSREELLRFAPNSGIRPTQERILFTARYYANLVEVFGKDPVLPVTAVLEALLRRLINPEQQQRIIAEAAADPDLRRLLTMLYQVARVSDAALTLYAMAQDSASTPDPPR